MIIFLGELRSRIAGSNASGARPVRTFWNCWVGRRLGESRCCALLKGISIPSSLFKMVGSSNKTICLPNIGGRGAKLNWIYNGGSPVASAESRHRNGNDWISWLMQILVHSWKFNSVGPGTHTFMRRPVYISKNVLLKRYEGSSKSVARFKKWPEMITSDWRGSVYWNGRSEERQSWCLILVCFTHSIIFVLFELCFCKIQTECAVEFKDRK